jgi:hypothetical protein
MGCLVGNSGFHYYVSVLALNHQCTATVLAQPVATQFMFLAPAFDHEQLAKVKVAKLRGTLRIGAFGHHGSVSRLWPP